MTPEQVLVLRLDPLALRTVRRLWGSRIYEAMTAKEDNCIGRRPTGESHADNAANAAATHRGSRARRQPAGTHGHSARTDRAGGARTKRCQRASASRGERAQRVNLKDGPGLSRGDNSKGQAAQVGQCSGMTPEAEVRACVGPRSVGRPEPVAESIDVGDQHSHFVPIVIRAERADQLFADLEEPFTLGLGEG
jgi:hypothetical protein